MCRLYRGFVFFTVIEIVFAPDNRRISGKERKTLKSQLFVCVLQGGYAVVKKSVVFEKVKTQVTMVTKSMDVPRITNIKRKRFFFPLKVKI